MSVLIGVFIISCEAWNKFGECNNIFKLFNVAPTFVFYAGVVHACFVYSAAECISTFTQNDHIVALAQTTESCKGSSNRIRFKFIIPAR